MMPGDVEAWEAKPIRKDMKWITDNVGISLRSRQSAGCCALSGEDYDGGQSNYCFDKDLTRCKGEVDRFLIA